MKNYKILFGFGDYTEIKSTELPVDNKKIFASLKEAEEEAESFKNHMQAYRCSACGGFNQDCPDCGGTGWL